MSLSVDGVPEVLAQDFLEEVSITEEGRRGPGNREEHYGWRPKVTWGGVDER